MASQLAEAHRISQRRIGLATVVEMAAAWRLLDPSDIDGSFADWLQVVIPIVAAQRTASARLAGNYLTAQRTLALGLDVAGFSPVLAGSLDLKAFATSMLVTGPVSIKGALSRGVQIGPAVDIAQARSSAAGMRHALNGGRETITETVKADQRAAGWQRVASGKACDFCSMLAGRGAVYGEASADFQAHDGCSCAAEPIYG